MTSHLKHSPEHTVWFSAVVAKAWRWIEISEALPRSL